VRGGMTEKHRGTSEWHMDVPLFWLRRADKESLVPVTFIHKEARANQRSAIQFAYKKERR